MRSAIELALQSYEGALILISHDRHMLKTSVDNFYLVYQQKVQAFDGDLDDYYSWLQTKDVIKENALASPVIDYKEKKTLQNRLKKLEQLIEHYQSEISKLDTQLGDSALYEDSAQQNKLNQLVQKRTSTYSSLNQAEEEWLEISSSLEDLV